MPLFRRCIAAFAAAWTAGCTTGTAPLTLEREGSFFVNGEAVRTQYPGASLVTGPSEPGQITVKQMYVQYRIPYRASHLPIVMVHGSNHTGATYETTPDGREGWATWFARKGAPVYVVDHSGRARWGLRPRRARPFGLRPDAVQPGARPGGREPRVAADAPARDPRAGMAQLPARAR